MHPEGGRGDAEDGEGHQHAVGNATVVDGGDDAHGEAQDEGEDVGEAGELDRGAKGVTHQVDNGLALRVGRAEVAVEHVAKPVGKLLEHGLVQAHLLTDALNGGLVGHIAHHDAHGVTRHDVEHEERDGRDGEDNADGQQDPLDEIVSHPPTPFLRGALRALPVAPRPSNSGTSRRPEPASGRPG